MTARSIAWMLTIDGGPYGAASLGAPSSITSTDSDYPAGLTVLPGALSYDSLRKLQWTEELKPTTAETTISGISLELDDVVPSSGIASGQQVWTYLFSRDLRASMYATLGATISSTATSITVGFDPGFDTGAQVIWIDREAINCSSFNAGTLTFTVASSGRGYLGTKATEHALDVANAFTPLVFASFVNPQRRRAILWRVEDGVATPVYRGYLGRAPRLVDGDTGRWEVQIDHALTVQMARPLGPSRTAVTVQGFQPETLRLALGRLGSSGAVTQFFSVLREPYTGTTPETIEDASAILISALNEQMALTATAPFSAVLRATMEGDSMRFECSANAQHFLTIGMQDVNNTDFSADATTRRPSRENAVEPVVGTWESMAYLYPARAHVMLRRAGGTFPVDSTTGIPSTLTTSYTDGAIATTLRFVLAGEDYRGIPFEVWMTEVNSSTRRITGYLVRSLATIGNNALTGVRFRDNLLLTQPTTLRLSVVATSTHWIRALQRGVFSSGFGLDEQADDRDWSWDTAFEVIDRTGGEVATSRNWVFDGSQSLGDFLKDALRLDACAIVTRGSRLAVLPFGPPLSTDAADYAITLSTNGVHRLRPGYTTLPEGIINTVRVSRENAPSITVNNQTSVALYGISRAIEVEAKGAMLTTLDNQTPNELARGMFSRVLGMWGEPAELVRVDTTIEGMDDLELGKIVSVTSSTLPDGQGARGTETTRRGRVVSRGVSIASGVSVGVLVYPHRVVGYAPAVRVDSISGNVLTVATSYLPESNTASDYAASESDDYTGTTPGDGGTSKFEVGDKVAFRETGTTTTGQYEGGFEIVRVDPSIPEIELDLDPSAGAIDWTAVIAGGGLVDLVPDTYNVATTTQRQYAYIGSRTNRDLGGNPLQEWAP